MPVPPWTDRLQSQLADGVRTTFGAHSALQEHRASFGIGRSGEGVSPVDVLQRSRLPTVRLEDLQLRGDVTIDGARNRRLETLLEGGQLRPAATLSAAAQKVLELFLRACGQLNYAGPGKEVLIPRPANAATFLSQFEGIEADRSRRIKAAVNAHETLDDLVCAAYSVTASKARSMINAGLPWSQG